jgi:signal transduction histidine kinase
VSAELKKHGGEAPTAASSIPPPPEDLRHVDRLAMIGWIATGLVHELGAKLGGVSAQAGMIANGEVDGESARASALIIVQQIERMTERMRELLAFAHEESRERAAVDLRALARRTAGLFVPQAAKRGVTLRMASGGPVEIDADETQIEQVVATLVHNGIQACGAGGSVGVSISESDVEGVASVCLEVVDDGAGIREEDQIRIFEPFFTTKEAGAGTGLGLSVAEAIVRDHQGWIDFESVPGQGSRFRVHLPPRASTP